jgi:cystathionine gamma-synthase
MSSAETAAGAAWRSQITAGFRYAHRAANLGCVETVVGPPAVTGHVECTAAERAAAGIPEGLIRYSTGIEDVADLRYALAVLP